MIKEKLNSVHIYTTNKCHLSCEYCLHKKDDEMMTIETANKIIDYLEKIECKALAFYGGEPLLNFPVVKLFIDRLKHKTIIGLATNGIELKGEIADYLAKDNNVTVLISIDPKMERRTKKYTPIIIENAKQFVKKRHENGGVVEANSVIYTDGEQKDYNENFQRYLVEELGFDSVNSTCLGGSSAKDYGEEIKHWLLKGYRPPNIAISEYIKVYMNNRENLSDCFHCEAGDKQLTFVSDGSIYACYKFYNFRRFRVGHIDTGIKQNLLNEWLEYRKNRTQNCSDCKHTDTCQGGCSYQHFVLSGEDGKNDKSFCAYRKAYLNKGKEIYQDVINEGSPLNLALLDSRRFATGYGKRYFSDYNLCSEVYKIDSVRCKNIFIPNTNDFNIYPAGDSKFSLYLVSAKKMYKINNVIAGVLEILSHEGIQNAVNFIMDEYKLDADKSFELVSDISDRIKTYF
jgi:uncharacterized protein